MPVLGFLWEEEACLHLKLSYEVFDFKYDNKLITNASACVFLTK